MFRDVSSIRLKVMLIVLVTSLAALLFASIVLVAYDVRTHRESWARDLTIQAEVVGRTSAPAIVYVLTLETQTLARACGKSHVHNMEPEDLVALTIEASLMTGVPLAGMQRSLVDEIAERVAARLQD